MVAFDQSSAVEKTRAVEKKIPDGDPQPGLEGRSLSHPTLRESGLSEQRIQHTRTSLTEPTLATQAKQVSDGGLNTQERQQAVLLISEARQLAREEGMSLQKRATGAEADIPPALVERLRARGIQLPLERVSSDPELGKSLQQAQQLGVKEGRDSWTSANATASQLYGAMQGWGTDEAAIFKALEGKSREDIQAIREAYKANYNSDLDLRLKNELGGSDLERAQALVSGDSKTATAAELYWSMKGSGTDEAAINRILSRPDAAEIEKVFNQSYARQYGVSNLQGALKAELGGDHLKQAQNLLAANSPRGSADQRAEAQAIADAAELHYAMKGFGGVGTDEATVHRVLEKSQDAQQLERLKKAYQAEYGASLSEHLKGELSFNHQVRALRLHDGDRDGASVAALRGAEWGWGVDRSSVSSVFEGTSEQQRRAILERYQQEFGRSFHDSVKAQVNKDALTVIDALAERGTLTDAEALLHSMVDLGTDEARLQQHLEGKSKAEIASIREEYQRLTGRNLDRDINGEVSGVYQFDATAALRGKPESIREIYRAMEERYKYERSGMDFFTDAWSDQGRVLDRQMNIARERMDRINAGRESATDRDDLAGLYDVHLQHAKAFRQAKDVVVDHAATIATAAAATIAIVATGPLGLGLGVWAALSVAAGSTAVARVGTKFAIKGARYDWGGELTSDVGISALEAGTAKLGAAITTTLGKTKLMTQLTGRGLTGRVTAAAVDGAADGIASGGLSGFGEGLLTSDFSGQGAGEILESLANRGGLGALGGGLGGAGMAGGLTGGIEILTAKRALRGTLERASEPAVELVTRDTTEKLPLTSPHENVAPIVPQSESAPGVDTSVSATPTPSGRIPVTVQEIPELKVSNIPAQSREHAVDTILARLQKLNGGRMAAPVDGLSYSELISDPDVMRWIAGMDGDLRRQITTLLPQGKLSGDVLLQALSESVDKFNHGQALMMDYLSHTMPFDRVKGVDITISPGKTYMLESEIGSGGFGKVVRARQVSVGPEGERLLGEPVALKITQMSRARDLDVEVNIPQEIALAEGTRIRSAVPREAVRFHSPELSGAGVDSHVGVIVMDLIDGQPLHHYLDHAFEVSGDAATAASTVARLAAEYDETYHRGWGVTDAHGGNVMIVQPKDGSAPGLVHIDRAAVAGPEAAAVYVAQMDHLESIAHDAVKSWRRSNPGVADPMHIQVLGQIERGIRSGSFEDFNEISDVFQRLSRALDQPSAAWSRQQLRALQKELDLLGIPRVSGRPFPISRVESLSGSMTDE